VSLVLEAPYPDLSSILAYMRAQVGFVKFIELTMKRSPDNIIADATKKPADRYLLDSFHLAGTVALDCFRVDWSLAGHKVEFLPT